MFKVVELLGNDFAKNMEHVAYGRFSLPDGKISSRRGKQAVLVDLIEHVTKKAKEVIKDRNFEIENIDDEIIFSGYQKMVSYNADYFYSRLQGRS